MPTKQQLKEMKTVLVKHFAEDWQQLAELLYFKMIFGNISEAGTQEPKEDEDNPESGEMLSIQMVGVE